MHVASVLATVGLISDALRDARVVWCVLCVCVCVCVCVRERERGRSRERERINIEIYRESAPASGLRDDFDERWGWRKEPPGHRLKNTVKEPHGATTEYEHLQTAATRW